MDKKYPVRGQVHDVLKKSLGVMGSASSELFGGSGRISWVQKVSKLEGLRCGGFSDGFENGKTWKIDSETWVANGQNGDVNIRFDWVTATLTVVKEFSWYYPFLNPTARQHTGFLTLERTIQREKFTVIIGEDKRTHPCLLLIFGKRKVA